MAGVWHCMLMVAALVFVCLLGSTDAVGEARSRPRPQRRPKKVPKVEPIDITPPVQNVDIRQMTGKWYLLNVASKCSYLMTHGTAVEPTVMTLTFSPDSDKTLLVSTKTRRTHQCWEILQTYDVTKGRLILKGTRPELNTDIVITDTDYSSYAIMVYQKREKVTVKFFSRVLDNLSEPLLVKFEQLAEKQGFGLNYLFPFPTYSHCGDVDQDHQINCVPTC